MAIIDLLMLSAATWYISFSVTNSDGPFAVFARAREWRGGRWHGRHGQTTVTHGHLDTNYNPIPEFTFDIPDSNGLLDCIVCLSLWVALVLAWLTGHSVLDALAIAGVSLWAHGWMGWRINL